MTTTRPPGQADRTPRLAFLYNSRESLWAGMDSYLYAAEGALKTSLESSDVQIRQRLGWSLRHELSQRLDDTSLAAAEHLLEPALTAIQIALSDAWRERGVEPSAVAGRSSSEIAAGYARGLLTHSEAIELACRVSRMMGDSRTAGRILLVTLPIATVEALQSSAPAPFHIASDAWWNVTVIACDVASLDAILEFFREQGAECRVEPMSIGPHSPLVDAARADFVKPLESSSVPSHARLAGYTPAVDTVVPDETPGPEYWWGPVMRNPLRIRRMIRRMVLDGYSVFLEIGTRISYEALIQDVDRELGTRSVALATMRWTEPLQPVMDESLATLARLGLARPVDGTSVDVRSPMSPAGA